MAHSGPTEPGRVLEIQRMSTEDGPGIRTTVFLKGCSLACTWCHNPESISPEPELVWHDSRCIGCRTCVEACPHGARTLDDDGAHVDVARCQQCFTCVDLCPTEATERLGTEWQLADLVDEVAKDATYFETSGGGVTLSGGEPALQASFAAAFLAACRERGLHTALDTGGLVGTAALLRVTAEADLVLFDLKELDPERHRQFTTRDNARILENAVAVAEQIRRRHRGEMWIRTPLIPEATATAENLTGIGGFIAEHLADVVTRWELCAFNNLCANKYRRLGRPWAHRDTPSLLTEELLGWEQIVRRSPVCADIVRASGPTRTGQHEGTRPMQRDA